jgi:hypothetical protein
MNTCIVVVKQELLRFAGFVATAVMLAAIIAAVVTPQERRAVVEAVQMEGALVADVFSVVGPVIKERFELRFMALTHPGLHKQSIAMVGRLYPNGRAGNEERFDEVVQRVDAVLLKQLNGQVVQHD